MVVTTIPRMLTVEEAGEQLQLHANTVYRLISTRALGSVRLSAGKIRVTEQQIIDYIASQTQAAVCPDQQNQARGSTSAKASIMRPGTMPRPSAQNAKASVAETARRLKNSLPNG